MNAVNPLINFTRLVPVEAITPVSVNECLSVVSPRANWPWALYPVNHTLPSVFIITV